jgi:bifunctional NMN adenylyltransferase/nudix hydrolase
MKRCGKAIVLVGSSRRARSPRNPFTFKEVEAYIRACFSSSENEKIIILPLTDKYNNIAWIAQVQGAVKSVAVSDGFDFLVKSPRIGLTGHAKVNDPTNYYLGMFPQWESVPAPGIDGLSATLIRDKYYADPVSAMREMGDHIPAPVAEFLKQFSMTPAYQWLVSENNEYNRLREMNSGLAYPPTFVTAESVVVQSAQVLMSERKSRPGRGLLSLPGGYVGQYETARECALRSLVKGAGLKVHPDIIDARMGALTVFDNPWRSERGRAISFVPVVELKSDVRGLPNVRDGYQWIPVAELNPEECFEDSYHIIDSLIGPIAPGGAPQP